MSLAVTAWSAIGALVFGVGSAVSSAPNFRIVQTAMVHDSGSNIVETAVEAGAFNTLATALTAAELVEPLASGGPFTVFAPTDAAFGKLDQEALANTLQPASRPRLQQVLKYHVVEGEFFARDLIGGRTLTTLSGQRIRVGIAEGEVRVNDSVITATDIRATNGVIHIIDTVLIPTKQTIADVASEAGQFKTLLAAAEAAGLVDTLSGAGSLTVFAPTDEAFANLPDGTVESLLRPENREALKSLLLYHVVKGPVFASDAIAAESAKTLNGEAVETSLLDGALFIDESRVLANDIEASNGVVHVIDRVLIPDSLTARSTGAARVIESAIERGAPLFNNGDADACVAIYEIAIESLVELEGDQLPGHLRPVLTRALAAARAEHDAEESAWILRRALDAAYSAVTEQRMTRRMTGPGA
ncbi:MAG: fasciclin domain-containing protein [Phycisphaerales bacterium]